MKMVIKMIRKREMAGLVGALSQLRVEKMVGVGGFEPPTSRSRTVRSSLTELHPDASAFNSSRYDGR